MRPHLENKLQKLQFLFMIVEKRCLDDVISASTMLLTQGTDTMAEKTDEYGLPSSGENETPNTTGGKYEEEDIPRLTTRSTVCVMEDHGSHDSMVRNNREQTDDDISTGDDDMNTTYYNKRVVCEEVCDKQSGMNDDTRGDDGDSDTRVNTDDDNRLVGGNDSVEKCIFKRSKCVTHGCDTKSFKVSVKKWQWIARLVMLAQRLRDTSA